MSSGDLMGKSVYFAVTGGREYADYRHVRRVLDAERNLAGPRMVVVQGECPTPTQGADGLAKRWCRENGVPCIGIAAHFRYFGKPAGPIRNAWMFDLLPIYKLIAFPGDRGTRDAIMQAEQRCICIRDERDSGRHPEGENAVASAEAVEGVSLPERRSEESASPKSLLNPHPKDHPHG